MGVWANSRLGESVSNLYGAKIRLGEFKAVYSMLACKGINMISSIRQKRSTEGCSKPKSA